MSDDLVISALELVKAVFRLAFCDYVGKAYGHDEPYDDKYTRINPELQAEAATFLTSPWATHLGDLAGFPAQRVWKQAQRDHLRRAASPSSAHVGRPRRQLGGGQRWLLEPADTVAA